MPIGSDSGPTVADIDISAYPLLPDPLSPVLRICSSLMIKTISHTPLGQPRYPRAQRFRRKPRSPPLSPLPSNVRPDVFHPKMLFRSQVSRIWTPTPAKPHYERDVLPRGIHTIIIQTVGVTEPVNIPVRVENEPGRRSHPHRKIALRSPSPSSFILSS